MDDYYESESIRRWIEVPHFAVPSWILRVFNTMGDRVAIGVLKAIFPGNSVDDVRLRKILAAIDASFEYPDMIDNPPDRVPAVTLCLLEILFSRVESTEHRDKIRFAAKQFRSSMENGDTKLPF